MPLGISPFDSESNMSQKVEDVLDSLHGKKEFDSDGAKSDVEKTATKIAYGLRWAMGCEFLLLCLLAFAARLPHADIEMWSNVAVVPLIALAVTLFVWAMLEIAPRAAFLFVIKPYMFRLSLREMTHDLAHAEELHRFDLAALKLAEHWLAIRIERLKIRLVFGVGGSDKVALLAVVAGAWMVWNNFPNQQAESIQKAYQIGGAIIGGLAIGGLFVNALIKQWSYQKDLLSIAIFQLDNA